MFSLLEDRRIRNTPCVEAVAFEARLGCIGEAV